MKTLVNLKNMEPRDYNNLGAAYVVRGQYSEAIEVFEEAYV